MIIRRAIIASALLGAASSGMAHPEPRLRFLNHSLLDFTGLSGDGAVAVGGGYDDVAGWYRGFRWEDDGGAGVMQFVGPPNWTTTVTATSRDGSMATVVEVRDQLLTRSFLWARDGTLAPVADLPGGNEQATVWAISADGGALAGSVGVVAGAGAARWDVESGAAAEQLGEIAGGGYSGAGRAVSADGSIIFGASQSAAGDELFRWTAVGGLERLGVPLPRRETQDARPMWCSADGLVVAGATFTNPIGWRPFIWSRERGLRTLGTLPPAGPGAWARSAGISADGRVVIGQSTGENFGSAFYWTEETGMITLKSYLLARGLPPIYRQPGDPNSYADWYLLNAEAISADGNTIVGIGGPDLSRLQLFVANLGFCRADLNRDDFLDWFDYTAYIEAFESALWNADFNHDGFIDFFDYADFVTAFEDGC